MDTETRRASCFADLAAARRLLYWRPIMGPFRDATESIEAEAAALAAQRRAELPGVPAGYDSLFVRRAGRIAFGVTGTLGAAVVAIALMYDIDFAPYLLVWSWAVALVAVPIAVLAASFVLRRHLRRAVARTGDPIRDVAALRALDLRALERALAARRAHASYAWPLVAITLLAPHTLQLLVASAWTHEIDLENFHEWMQATSLFTVHVFFYGVYAAWTFPRQRSIGRPVWIATGLSAVPGILLLGIPPLIVFFTALAIAIGAYLPMRGLMEREMAQAAMAELEA